MFVPHLEAVAAITMMIIIYSYLVLLQETVMGGMAATSLVVVPSVVVKVVEGGVAQIIWRMLKVTSEMAAK
jgi:hypothetical protein